MRRDGQSFAIRHSQQSQLAKQFQETRGWRLKCVPAAKVNRVSDGVAGQRPVVRDIEPGVALTLQIAVLGLPQACLLGSILVARSSHFTLTGIQFEGLPTHLLPDRLTRAAAGTGLRGWKPELRLIDRSSSVHHRQLYWLEVQANDFVERLLPSYRRCVY
jgi:hypothetical protein